MSETKPKKPRLRSPAYPAIDLESAISRAKQFKEYAETSAVTITHVLEHWGYKGKSSGGMKIIAALGYYGFIEDSGTGDRRKVKLTERARRIILDHSDSPVRAQEIKDAALSPAIFMELWEHYDGEVPPEAELRTFLVLEKNFNEKAVNSVIADFKNTIEFAGLSKSDILNDPEKPNDLGDQKGTDGARRPSINPAVMVPKKLEVGMNQDTFTLDEGQALLQWPDNFTPESYEDFEGWIQLVLRKAKRSIGKHTQTEPESREGED